MVLFCLMLLLTFFCDEVFQLLAFLLSHYTYLQILRVLRHLKSSNKHLQYFYMFLLLSLYSMHLYKN